MSNSTTDSLLEKGMACLQNHDVVTATALLQKAAELSPGDITILSALGQTWEQLQDVTKARECYLRALAVNPAAVQIHQGLARLHLRGPHYLEGLRRIHANLQPGSYVEIGIRQGSSFKLASPEIPAVGIDPNPLVDAEKIPARHVIIRDTSDNYFQSGRLPADLGGRPVDLALIDGMHLFEFALRDFIALEKSAHNGATILVHDCYPLNELTSRREQETPFWSGDVWKLILCLKQYRDDLKIITLPCPPTGLAAITNLDPGSTVLPHALDKICHQYIPLDFSAIDQDQKCKLNLAELAEALQTTYLKQ
jgi:tetratricopeptide (TPR) repeat protein